MALSGQAAQAGVENRTYEAHTRLFDPLGPHRVLIPDLHLVAAERGLGDHDGHAGLGRPSKRSRVDLRPGRAAVQLQDPATRRVLARGAHLADEGVELRLGLALVEE